MRWVKWVRRGCTLGHWPEAEGLPEGEPRDLLRVGYDSEVEENPAGEWFICRVEGCWTPVDLLELTGIWAKEHMGVD